MSEDKKICYNCFCQYEAENTTCPACGYDPEWDKEKYPLALPHGHVLCDKYIVGRVLGQGGYGITYLALDKWLMSKVAVKEYFPEIGARREDATGYVAASSLQKKEDYDHGKEDFLQEARVLAAFTDNPNIVKIYGYFEENGTAYFAMEYVQGISLQNYIRNNGGKLAWRDAYDKLLPIINVLEAVHKKGIIHRDISPDNIYITADGTVKLLDFGAARQQSLNQSHSLDVILKHGYAPFEQYNRRGSQGPFTDVYALCACFYAAVTGFLPKDAPERVAGNSLETFEQAGIEIPEAVAKVLYSGLEVFAQNRYQNMTELRQALVEAVTSGHYIAPVSVCVTAENTSQTLVNTMITGNTDHFSNNGSAGANSQQDVKTMGVTPPGSTPDTVKKKKIGIAAAIAILLIGGFGIFWFAHPHDYGEWIVTKAASCTEEGEQERKCFCGAKEIENLAITDHVAEIIAAVEASCTESGLTEGSRCKDCGKILEPQHVIDALGHHKVIDSAIPASCTQEGKSQGAHCSICEEILIAQEVTAPKTGHTEVVLPAVKANCMQEGKTEGKKCSVCNKVLVAQQVTSEKTDHTVVTDKAVEATCAKTGLTEGSHCSVCNKVIKKQEIVAKNENHKVVTDKAVAATCAKTGLTEGSHCSVCNKVLKEQKVVAKNENHKVVTDKAVAATCQKTGLTEGSHCSVCDKVIKKQETVAKTGHKEVKDKAVAATCTKAGKTEGSHCSVCNTVIKKQETVKAKGHSFTEDEFECVNCGVDRFKFELDSTTHYLMEDTYSWSIYAVEGETIKISFILESADPSRNLVWGYDVYDENDNIILDEYGEVRDGDKKTITIRNCESGTYIVLIGVSDGEWTYTETIFIDVW